MYGKTLNNFFSKVEFCMVGKLEAKISQKHCRCFHEILRACSSLKKLCNEPEVIFRNASRF